MRRCVILIVCVGLAGCAEEKGLPEKPAEVEAKPTVNPLAPPKPEKEDPAARAIVNQAIDAHTGGKPERLEKFKKHHMVLKGQIRDNSGSYTSYTGELWASWPDDFAGRFDIPEFPSFSFALRGPIGVQRTPAVVPMSPLIYKTCAIDCAVLNWGGTLTALTAPAIYHSPATATAAGRSFRTVKRWTEGQPEWTLWFDEKTNLLERIDYHGYESGLVKAKSMQMSKHADHEGVKLPRGFNLLVGGAQFFQVDMTEFQTPDAIDAKTFTDPPAMKS